MHPHDHKWVQEQLALLPSQMRDQVLKKYEAVYLQVVSDNAGKIAAEGLARREANTRLKECVDKFGLSYGGQTISPPRVK